MNRIFCTFACEIKNIMKKKIILILTVLVGFALQSANAVASFNTIRLKSRDGKIIVSLYSGDRHLSYDVTYGGKPVIGKSPLGLIVDKRDLGGDVTVVARPQKRDINDRYPLLGSHAVAINRAQEWMIPLESSHIRYQLFVRLYDDGVAIRYTIPDGAKRIDRELTSWNLTNSVEKLAWSEYSTCYEGKSYVTPVSKISEGTVVLGPVTVQGKGYYLSVSEADCEDFPDMAFVKNRNMLLSYFPTQREGWSVNDSASVNTNVLHGRYRGYRVTPWRTVIIANSLTALVNSDLLTNVCPARSKNADFSWVKPGRCLWQWWSIGAPQFEDQHQWYDAAAKLKWEYYLIDEGWRGWRQDGKDNWQMLREAIAYGNKVGVKTLVWVNSKEMRHAAERRAYLEKVKACGAVGIKIDFIPQATPDIMKWYVGGMQDCAELKLLLNYHGSVKPTGLSRFYPNDITREAVRGDEWHMSRYKRVMPYEQDVCLPFTRLMSGPADVTPVMLNPAELSSAKYTWAHEFAQAIVYLSPITHFCDKYNYYLDSPMFDLFQDIPTVWDETRVLDCTRMGEVVAYARRKGDVWWIGVMNGADSRKIKIRLDFARDGAKAILVYDDSASQASIKRQNRTVSCGETINLNLAAGGGFVAKISNAIHTR